MKRIYANRLLKLAAFLEKLPEDRFDYSKWVGPDWRGMPDLSCGTTACALGWATTMPAFRRLRLRLTSNLDDCARPVIGAGGRSWSRAARVIFGLSRDDADFLFTPANGWDFDSGKSKLGIDASAKEVARHIRAFVERDS